MQTSLVAPVARTPAQKIPIDVLIMKGGGVKGLAFAGGFSSWNSIMISAPLLGRRQAVSLPPYWPLGPPARN